MEEIVIYKNLYNPQKEQEVFKGIKKACQNFIGNYAYKHNFGIYRCWYEEGSRRYYYDCGNTVFYTYQDLDMIVPESTEKSTM